jgi:hypothetical protein
MYIGLVALDDEFSTVLQVRNTSAVPVQPDSAPIYRIYGDDGAAIAQGTLTNKESGSVTNATFATPIVITSAAHGLQNGMRVTITGVGGNTAANTTAVVANKTTDTFELAGVAGNGAYTSGGTWVVSGLYAFDYTPETANGFVAGTTYTVVFFYIVSSTTYSPADATRTFTVTT